MLLVLGIALSGWAYYQLVALDDRSQFENLFAFYSLAFAGFYCLYRSNIPVGIVLCIGLGIRFFFWSYTPVLSQDFYRFLWDGQLQLMGKNPFLYTPNELTELLNNPLMQQLYEGMGGLSQQHHSNYPPASQWVFFLLAWLGGSTVAGQVSLLRGILIAGDVAGWWGLRKALRHYGLPLGPSRAYFLNPLLIVEGTGNLHGEGLMLAAVAWGIWYFSQGRWVKSAFFFALGVAIKLLPLLWLPLLLQKAQRKGSCLLLGFGSLFSLLFWGLYLPPQGWSYYIQTLQLWFSNFEFNASWYYLIREWGYQQTGYNIIRKLGKITPWIVLLGVVVFSLWPLKGSSRKLWERVLGLVSLYFFIATTVHPWYVIQLLFLAAFTPYRYPWLWSYTVFLSYVAYRSPAVAEPFWLVWVEYGPIYGLLAWEIGYQSIRNRLTSCSFK